MTSFMKFLLFTNAMKIILGQGSNDVIKIRKNNYVSFKYSAPISVNSLIPTSHVVSLQLSFFRASLKYSAPLSVNLLPYTPNVVSLQL